eukprot:gene37671-42668_t
MSDALLMAHINSHALAPRLQPKLRYSVERDCVPIVLGGVTPNLLIASPAQKARPAPLSTMARTVSSASACAMAARSSASSVGVQALSRSGRSKVIEATRPIAAYLSCVKSKRVSWSVAPCDGHAASIPAGPGGHNLRISENEIMATPRPSTAGSTRARTQATGTFVRSTPGSHSLERGLALLRAFRHGVDVLTNAELADRAQLPRPTVSRLTRSLVDAGFLAYDIEQRGYRLTAACLSLA